METFVKEKKHKQMYRDKKYKAKSRNAKNCNTNY